MNHRHKRKQSEAYIRQTSDPYDPGHVNIVVDYSEEGTKNVTHIEHTLKLSLHNIASMVEAARGVADAQISRLAATRRRLG